jgi:hypothetical protein
VRASIHFVLWVLAGTAATLLMIAFATRAFRGAKRSQPGVSAVGWALLFLTSGRMPPPPPETQIELETQSRKDRGNSQQDP